MTEKPKTFDEITKFLDEKASSDDAFRERLMSDPKGTISTELGIAIPEQYQIQVHEMSDTTGHLVLSPSPKLTESQLQGVAGGGWGGSSDPAPSKPEVWAGMDGQPPRPNPR